MKKFNFKNKNIRFGGYQTIVAIIVIAIAIAVNVVFSGLNIRVDLTEEQFFSLSDKTEEIAKGISHPISIYVLEETGTETPSFKEILSRYNKLNSNISLIYKDPILYPQFTKKYIDDQITKIDTGSIIIEDTTTGKYKVLTQTDLYNFGTSTYGTTSIESLAIENAVTSALGYVTTVEDRVIYITSGHGELELPSTFTSLITKSNMTTQSISLSTEDLGAPDTSTLIIYSPHSDFNDVEIKKITDFLDAGGKAMIFADYDTPELTNFSSLLSYYGLQQISGAVVETANSNMLTSYPTYLIPNYTQHDITSSLISNKLPLLIPLSSALIENNNVRNGITIAPLISTSDGAFLKTQLEDATTEKTSSDIDGPFDLAYAIEEVNALDSTNVITTRLVVLADSYFIDDTKINLASTGNETFVTNCLGWLQNDSTTSFAIAGKSFNDYSLPAMSTTQLLIFGGLTVIIIPLAIIIAGVMILIRRKNL